MTRNTGMAALAFALAAIPPTAVAQDESAAEVEEASIAPPIHLRGRRMPGTPEVRVVAFSDRHGSESGDCDAAMARVGQCVELVDFMPVDPLLNDGIAASKADRDAFRNISDIYARIWEDVSYRWKSSEAVERLLVPYGVSRIPPPSDHWEAIGAGPGEPLYGLPHSSYWVNGASFLPEVGQTPSAVDESIYRYIRYNREVGLPRPHRYAVLSGRFATRMIFDEEPRKIDMMDADPTSSAPFFEQMYPYRTARFFGAGDLGFGQEERSVTIPLSHFEVPPELRTPPRLQRYLTPGVGTEPERVLTEAETRAVEERITRARIRRAGFAPLLFTPSPTSDEARRIAVREYEAFYRDVGAQVVKFGRENYTPTHLRVLSALFAMQSPPGQNESFVSSVDLEAIDDPLLFSSEEDDEGTVETPPIEESATTSGDDVYYYDDEAPQSSYDDVNVYDDSNGLSAGRTNIAYTALPPRLVAAHLEYLSNQRGLRVMDQDFADFLHNEYRKPADQRALLKDRARAVPPEGDETVVDWIRRYSVRYAKGANEQTVEEGMNRLALETIINAQAERDVAQADLMETSLLLDHVRYAIADRFVVDAPPEDWATSVAQEAVAEEQWIEVLAAHSYYPAPLDEPDDDARNSWYDPLSVCTTERDFNAASEEPVFGAVNLDLLIVAEDGQDVSAPYTALWDARDRVPFMWVDDPRESAEPPVMTRMVGLPDDEAIYRIRWRVWTGWHLFWGTEGVGGVQFIGEVPEAAAAEQLVWMRRHYDWLREYAGTPVVAEDAQRVALRTGAVCSDLALVDPDVVATLVRAALLDGDFRPTSPYDKGDNRGNLRGEDATVGVRVIGNRNVDARTSTRDGAEVGTAIVDENEIEGVTGILPPRNPPENIADIRRWVLPQIGALSNESLRSPTMLVVFDSQVTDKGTRTHHWQPRVPYFREERNLPHGEHVITAGWALAIPPGEVARPRMLSPDWVDTNSVNAENLNPRWRQRRTLHFTMAGDLGLRPIHDSRTRCGVNVPPDPATGPCTSTDGRGEGDIKTDRASGVLARYTLLQTLWLGSNRRLAVEYGLGVGFAAQFKPLPFVYNKRDMNDAGVEPVVGFTTRVFGGPVVGIRGGSNPRKLYRRRGRGALWGAKDRDESTRQGRSEYGMRLGLSILPFSVGFTAEVHGDLWYARSITPGRAKNRMFTAYHPSFLVGPFLGGRYGGNIGGGNDDMRRPLLYTASVDVGIRIQARLFNYAGDEPTAGIK